MNTLMKPDAQFLAPTFKRAALIWWAWVWRSMLLGLGASLFIGFVLSISGVLNTATDAAVRYASLALGVVAGVPMGIWAFQMVLEKNFREFTIRLVPRAQNELASSLEQKIDSDS
jgi:hypothetical protein